MRSKWVNEIKGFESLTGYKVYEDGTIESYIVRHDKEYIISENPRRIMHPYLTRKKYLKVHIRSRAVFLHRLIALAFIPNIENKPQINHIDGNKQNNNVWNLEWCTNTENHKHKVTNGLNVTPKGEKHYLYGKSGRLHHMSKKVLQLSLNGDIINTYGSAREAGRYLGKHYSSISKCCNGKLEKAFGFKWEYE